MRRCAGIRRWVRWGCVAALVVIAAVWGASAWGWAVYYPQLSRRAIGIGIGTIGATWLPAATSDPRNAWSAGLLDTDARPRIVWLPRIESTARRTDIAIPLWIPWLLAAGFTFWRFRAVRIKLKDLCPGCGYDTRGLAPAAPCPECGARRGDSPGVRG